MLAAFRNMLKGPGKWVFVVVTLAAFLLVGDFNFDRFGATDAVRIGERGYTVQDVDRAFVRRLRQVQAEAGQGVTRQEAIDQGLLDATINDLTVRAVFETEADRLGLTATDAMIQRALRESGVFDDPLTGEFSTARLQQALSQSQVSPSEFREEVRQDIVRDQIVRALATPERAPEDLIRKLLLRVGERRAVRTAVVTAEDAPAPDEDALRSYYAANAEDYRVPERRSFRLVRIDETTLGAPEVSEEDLRALYDSRQGTLGEPERRAYRQARFASTEDAEVARGLIAAGGDFAEVATNAGASVSASEPVTRESLLDEAVADALFAAEGEGLAGVVDGVFGPVLLEVTEVVPGTRVSFEDAREDLTADFRAEILRDEVFEAVETIENTLDEGATLEEAAAEAGLGAPQTIGPVAANRFTAEGEIADVPVEAIRAAFALEEGEESDAVPLPDGGYAYVILDRIDPSVTQPFEEVADAVRADYDVRAADDALAAAIDSFRASVEAGTSFEDAASLAGSDVQERTIAARAPDPSLPPQLLRDLFDARLGAIVAAPVPNENRALVAIIDEVSFAEDPAAESFVGPYRDQVGQQVSEELVNSYLEALRQEAGVTRNDALLSRQFDDG